MGYTKLWEDIIHSTIWREPPHIKVVWVTMLAMADANGFVFASLPGLADVARVTADECREALACLSSPDLDSRSKEKEGRRIEGIDGGWFLINHEKYRKLRSSEDRREQVRLAVQRHREKKKSLVIKSKQRKPRKAQAEEEADPEEDRKDLLPAGRSWSAEACDDWAERTAGIAPGGQIGRHLKPVVDACGWDDVRPAWQRYLDETEVQFLSPARFAQTYGRWSTSKPLRLGEDRTTTADEATARTARIEELLAEYCPFESCRHRLDKHANGGCSVCRHNGRECS